MDAIIQKKYFSGRSKPGIWSSVYNYKPQKPEFRKTRGEIFAAISLMGPKEFDLSDAGNLLLDKLHESYFENRSDPVLIALEKALLETSSFLQQFLEKDAAGKKGVELDVISLVVISDIVYVAALGNGRVYVYRDQVLSDLSGALRDPTGEGILKEASFLTKKGDVLFIATPQLEKELRQDELEQAAVSFSEKGIRNHQFEKEAAVSLMLIGNSIDREALPFRPKQAFAEEEQFDATDEVKESAEKEMLEEDAATMAISSAEEQALEESELNEDTTLEDLVVADQQEEVEEVSEEPVLLTEEDDLEEALIEETAEVEKDEDTRLPLPPQSPVSRVRGGASQMLGKVSAMFKPAPQRRRVDNNAEDLKGEKTYKVFLKKAGMSLLKVLDSIKSVVWDKWLGMKIDRNNIYLQSAARKRKWGLLIMLILVIAAVVFISFQNLAQEQQVKANMEKAANALTEAKGLISEVNTKAGVYATLAVSDPRKQEPLAKLDQAQEKLEEARVNPDLANDISEQEQIISEIKDKFNKLIPVEASKILVDMGARFPGIKMVDMAVTNNTVYLLPGGDTVGSIYGVDYNGNVKEVKVELTDPQSMTADDKGNLIVLDRNSDRGLVVITPSSGSSTRLSATSQSVLAGVTEISFSLVGGQGRIYLIKPADQSIYFYSRTGSSYSTISKRNSIEELSSGKDLEVNDGSIYLLMQADLGLYRDWNKSKDNISVTGLGSGDNLLGASALFVDTNYVYIADPTKERLLVFGKDGTNIPLIAQYTYRGDSEIGWTNLEEVEADRLAQKIFVLDNSNVYMLSISSLLEFIN